MWDKSDTYIADPSRPLGQVIEGRADVEQSHVESVQEGQTLMEDEHGRQTGSPLGLRQQPHRPLRPPPQPGLQAPPLPGAAAPLLTALQLGLQAHQDLVQEVREEAVAEDEEASSGPGGDVTFSGIHLDDVDVLLAQSLVTWGGEGYK